MDAQELKKAFRRGWLLVFLGIVYSMGFWLLAIETNMPEEPPVWDMDGKPFVPASSPYADGYPLVDEKIGVIKEAK